MSVRPRVAVAGVHGHGARHVENVLRLAAAGQAELVGVADPRPAEIDAPTYPSLDDLLEATEVDVVIISTPIQTHVPLATQALRSGADVLLEKPPTASLAAFEELMQVVDETGRACQVGFQAQASAATLALRSMIAANELGELRGITATGKWVRTAKYYDRAPWAGQRILNGVPVVDGAITNPLAHATAAALLLDGSTGVDDVQTVETDLYRANPIESDDTSTVRITTARGTTILIAVTLCATTHLDPELIVHGTDRDAVLRYTTDDLDGTKYTRADLLENLLAHRTNPTVRLYCPLRETGAFTRVVEAIRTAPDPRPIPPTHIHWQGEGPDRRPIIPGIEHQIDQAAANLALFRELKTFSD